MQQDVENNSTELSGVGLVIMFSLKEISRVKMLGQITIFGFKKEPLLVWRNEQVGVIGTGCYLTWLNRVCTEMGLSPFLLRASASKSLPQPE